MKLTPLCEDDWNRPRHFLLRENGQILDDTWTRRGRLLFRVYHWYPQ